MIQLTPASFSLDMAALAARREYLDLDKWLSDRIAQRDVGFVENCLRFLRLKTGPERVRASARAGLYDCPRLPLRFSARLSTLARPPA